MRRQYATDSAIGHSSEQAHLRVIFCPWPDVFTALGACNHRERQQQGAGHPCYELSPAHERQELIEVMGGLADSAEDCNEDGATEDKDGATQRPSGEGLAKDDGSTYRIEHQSRLVNVSYGHLLSEAAFLTACRVDKTGNGRVVICTVLPARLLTMNISIPS